MILRLNIYRLALKVTIYLLLFPAFKLGWKFWAASMAVVGRPVLYDSHGHIAIVIFSSFVWAFMAEHYHVTSVDEVVRERTGIRAAWAAVVATAVVLLGALYFMRNAIFPRGLFVFIMVALLMLSLLSHVPFRVLCRQQVRLGRPSRLLIVGADQFAHDAAVRLCRMSFVPCEVAAFVRLPGQEIAVPTSRVYELADLPELHAGNGIDEAVMAINPTQFSRIPRLLKALEKLSVPMRAIVDLGEGIVVRERLFQLGRMQMLDLTPTPADLSDYVVLKRTFDICFSSLVLLVSAPVILLIALVTWLTSPGPIFFAQERIGLNGVPFRMYKFRTMRMASSRESDTRWTTDADPRRTRFGSFLRKTSLDELPQFINVLKGDMSVVGPRPERPFFVHKFSEEITRYNQRHALKVGITGWAQVNGWRGNTSIAKRVEYDLYYLQNWTFSFDLRIILMTVFAAFVGRNAY